MLTLIKNPRIICTVCSGRLLAAKHEPFVSLLTSRLSYTVSCHLSCSYCFPVSGVEFLALMRVLCHCFQVRGPSGLRWDHGGIEVGRSGIEVGWFICQQGLGQDWYYV